MQYLNAVLLFHIHSPFTYLQSQQAVMRYSATSEAFSLYLFAIATCRAAIGHG
jgi:hypothetical protein